MMRLMCASGSIATAEDWKGKKLRGTGALGVLTLILRVGDARSFLI